MHTLSQVQDPLKTTPFRPLLLTCDMLYNLSHFWQKKRSGAKVNECRISLNSVNIENDAESSLIVMNSLFLKVNLYTSPHHSLDVIRKLKLK